MVFMASWGDRLLFVLTYGIWGTEPIETSFGMIVTGTTTLAW